MVPTLPGANPKHRTRSKPSVQPVEVSKQTIQTHTTTTTTKRILNLCLDPRIGRGRYIEIDGKIEKSQHEVMLLLHRNIQHETKAEK